MYCQKCGCDCGENNFCTKCGNQLTECAVVKTQEPAKAPVLKSNACAIVGFIFSFFMPLVGLILGIIGYGYKDLRKPQHKALAVGAIAISAAQIVLNYIASLVAFSVLWNVLATTLNIAVQSGLTNL